MALKDIIGQENAINILKGVIRKNRVPHALLFVGEDGIGKKFTAINFAKALNCHRTESSELRVKSEGLFEDPEPRTPNGLIDSCDQCPSCVKINKLLHPEILITPEEDEAALKEKIYMSHPDVALIMPYKAQIRINVIRKLEKHLSYKPFEGNYKIAIIDDADKMTHEASNAFLKTLEAPASQSIIILISSKPELLLPTIRSRCQKVIFSSLPASAMEKLLLRVKGGSNKGALCLISALSGGRLGYALNEDLIKQRDSIFNEFLVMLERPEKDLWADRDEMQEWFDWCPLWLRDIAVLKATGMKELMINKDKNDDIADISKKASLKDIIKLSRRLDDLRGALKFNLNIPITIYHTSMLLKKMLGRMNA